MNTRLKYGCAIETPRSFVLYMAMSYLIFNFSPSTYSYTTPYVVRGLWRLVIRRFCQ